MNAHVAEDDEQALREVHAGERRETVTYFEDTLGRPPGRADDPLREGVKMGTTLVGTPDTVAKGIERLLGYSNGGFGGVLFRAHEWANRESTLRSYELFARYVMPRFQGSLDTIVGSNQWARDNRKAIFGPNVAAVKKAFTDVGREVPEEFRQRTPGRARRRGVTDPGKRLLQDHSVWRPSVRTASSSPGFERRSPGSTSGPAPPCTRRACP